ncbi:BolA family transcriptional regulator [Limibaculum sp. M0105]|uniref:BolA family transcriptional regulator n=1 Tax=Thermohalobaculum xanthum TaxID=2753746 RepID=A0A8J7M7N9_9RHOB|nr:BolA family protein [Thermohalobaculum xanthum]MBK0400106.1 BolA family transcriptional regulator [Thermohalobaculum xanthum]
MPVATTIEDKLRQAFAPEALELIDESERHRGHGGWREGGETHFRLRMTAAAFAGQGRVARQRAVNKVLAEELAGPVHALAMELRAPGEA